MYSKYSINGFLSMDSPNRIGHRNIREEEIIVTTGLLSGNKI